VPSETSVSIVEVACRRFVHAARWNGYAPQTTTGAASTRDSHCQYVNCQAGTIAIAITGTVSTVDTTSRWRSERSGSSSSITRSAPSAPAARGGSGRRAVYPAASTAATSASRSTPSVYVTLAFSVA
jgi:hypothetical protein